MAGQLWVPGAERLNPSAPGGTPDYPENPPRAVAHTTECPSGGRGDEPNYWFWKMHQVLTSKGAEPHVLYDPLTDKLGQYFGLDRTGRALKNDGGRRTNRVGRACIQIEFVGYASRPFTRNWKPGPNFQALMRAIGSWGIPDEWPSGKPPAYPDEHDERSAEIWYSRGGWYGHSQIPGNYHGDPGAIDDHGEFFAAQVPERREWPAWFAYPGRSRLGAGLGQNARANLLIKAALIAHDGPTGFRGELTSKWDGQTQEKLDAFRSERKIEAGGVSREVWRALGSMPASAPALPDKIGSGTNNGNLVGQALMVLQGFARPLNWSIGRGWGGEARTALRRFQLSEPRLQGDPDGKWGPLTWKLAWTDDD